MKSFALLLVLLMASPALSQTVSSSSLDPGTATEFQRKARGEEGGDGTVRALKHRLRRELVDLGLSATFHRMPHFGAGVARVLGIAGDPQTEPARFDRPVTCRWEVDPFDLSLTLDLVHRYGVVTSVEVDLDDRRIALGVKGHHHVTYGLSYEDEGNTLQALVTLPF